MTLIFSRVKGFSCVYITCTLCSPDTQELRYSFPYTGTMVPYVMLHSSPQIRCPIFTAPSYHEPRLVAVMGRLDGLVGGIGT